MSVRREFLGRLLFLLSAFQRTEEMALIERKKKVNRFLTCVFSKRDSVSGS